MAVKTKLFYSTMTGAPTLSGTAGDMLAVLNACLVDGFNSQTITSLVIASNVATITKNGHGFIANQVVEISGATPAALNDTWLITSADANTCTFSTTGLVDQTATGTITCKVASCGWEKQFSDTNRAVYRSGNAQSTLIPIRVDDTVGQYSTVLMAESFSDISTPVTSSATHYFKKSSATSATTRPWIIISDDKTFYLGLDWNSTGTYDFVSFGDFDSNVPADAYKARIQGCSSSAPAAKGQYHSIYNAMWEDQSGSTAVAVAPRSYAQTGAALALYQGSLCAASTYSATNVTVYVWAFSGNHGYSNNPAQAPIVSPGLADSGYHFVPVYLLERPVAGRTFRGTQRGLLHVLEQLPISSGYQVLTGVNGIPGGRAIMVASYGHLWNGGHVYYASVVAFSLGDW